MLIVKNPLKGGFFYGPNLRFIVQQSLAGLSQRPGLREAYFRL